MEEERRWRAGREGGWSRGGDGGGMVWRGGVGVCGLVDCDCGVVVGGGGGVGGLRSEEREIGL